MKTQTLLLTMAAAGAMAAPVELKREAQNPFNPNYLSPHY
ncbi:unnamed protein product [Cercospora beticola]|nr:unnamed protein product [Cercospora beticola]